MKLNSMSFACLPGQREKVRERAEKVGNRWNLPVKCDRHPHPATRQYNRLTYICLPICGCTFERVIMSALDRPALRRVAPSFCQSIKVHGFLHIDKAARNAPLNCHNCRVCEGLESGAIFTQNYLQLLRKTAWFMRAIEIQYYSAKCLKNNAIKRLTPPQGRQLIRGCIFKCTFYY